MLRRSVLALVAASAATMPASALAAPAGNVEVVSRAWGAGGASPYALTAREPGLSTGLESGVVSDDGRYAAFTVARDASALPSGAAPDWSGAPIPLYLRDVKLNQTIEITSEGRAIATGIDRTGRYLSYQHSASSHRDVPATLWVYDIVTRARTLVGRASGSNGAQAQDARGRITGDGKSVVFLSSNVPGAGSGLFRRTLSSAVTTRLGDGPTDGGEPAEITGVSDDGLRVATTGSVITPTRTTVVEGVPAISPGGSVAAYTRRTPDGTLELVQLDPATGVKTLLPAPRTGPGRDQVRAYVDAGVAWVSPDGREIGVVPTAVPDGDASGAVRFYAQVIDRVSKQWRPAGAYADALIGAGGTALWSRTGLIRSAISRNGRYSVFAPIQRANRYAPENQVRGLLVADNWGQNGIPGGVDLPTTNFYFEHTGLGCPTNRGTTVDRFAPVLAPEFLPRATAVRAVVTIGGRVVLDATTGDPNAYADAPMDRDASSYRVAVTATFAGGRSATGTYDFPLSPDQFC